MPEAGRRSVDPALRAGPCPAPTAERPSQCRPTDPSAPSATRATTAGDAPGLRALTAARRARSSDGARTAGPAAATRPGCWRASPHSTTRSPARSSTACPQDWWTLYVRELLVAAGVLPMRQENFARLRLWLRVRLANLPPHQARVTANDRVDIRTAITFMTWLDDNSITLADLSQEVLDLWLTSHPPRPIGLHPLGRRPPSDGHQRPLRHPPPHRLRPFPVHPEQLDDIPRSSHKPRKPLVHSWLR